MPATIHFYQEKMFAIIRGILLTEKMPVIIYYENACNFITAGICTVAGDPEVNITDVIIYI